MPRIALLTSAEIVPEPLGLVLIISSWNFPFGELHNIHHVKSSFIGMIYMNETMLFFYTGLSLEPLIGAIAAGNTAVLKPSEMSPACSSLLTYSLVTYLDNEAVKVVEGGPEVSQELLQQKWDKIFFTGEPYQLFFLVLSLCHCHSQYFKSRSQS